MTIALEHLEVILEAMRGKTVVNSISIEAQSISRLRDTNSDAYIKDGEVQMPFSHGFMASVRWEYYTVIKKLLTDIDDPRAISLHAGQLFTPEKQFSLRFSAEGIRFSGREHMEDTLFFDLQRYCEHNKVPYEVIP